uniref:Ig-like domain-containing protein n=1 Tax=Branchiostoma floridae TaxID=7739 RepID=C3ZHZ7_BRAFL|eukprot:XP_002591841.1 hypothetical protein BRAFLDRAFT_88785 [Branchiostoma floridae]
MAVKLMANVCLLLLLQLMVSRIDAGSWQSCRKVSVAKCGVGGSRDGHEYRYDIGAYRYKWTKYPSEAYSYQGPFRTVALSQVFQSCQVCSNETRPTQGGPTQNPSLPPARTNIMIVDNDVGELDTQKTELLTQIPCGRYCRLWFVGCILTAIEGGAFAKLPQVSTLVIWRSNIQTLRNGTFAGMDGLKYLLLLENNLTHLEAIKSVEYVHAVENKLTAIGTWMFHGLERLLVLNLEGNRISHIAAGAFHSNTKMRSLSLSGNRLTFLSGGWFRSTFPLYLIVHENAIATIALKKRELRGRRITLDNPPRCTCANDQLYEHKGNTLKFNQLFFNALVLSTTSCPASALNLNSPAPVNPNSLPCPAPLVEIVNVERSAAYKYEAVGDVFWEQSPVVSFVLPNGLHHQVNMTYDTNTTTHDSLPTGNLTVRVVTDLKAEGWVKCEGPQNLLGESGNDSSCSNYMGKSRFTLWLETTEPLAFGNTTCTASSETGSHTAVFMASEPAHSGITTPQATELSLMNTTPFSTIISTTLLLTDISTTPLPTSASDDGYGDLLWYIVYAAIGLLSPLAVLGVWGCAMYIWRRVRRKAPGNPAGPSRNGHQITACSRWPVGDGNMDESVISPYAEGRFEDHESLKETDSVISPYAEGGFADHPDLRRADSSQSETVPYGEAKLCAAYAGRARAQTHPVPSRPYSTERPRQTPNREGAVLAAYGPNGRDKSDKKCYQHPSILPDPGTTQSSAYQQNASAAQRSRKARCYNSPALATDQERTLSSTYDQNDPRETAKCSKKAPCYNSPALATDQERTLSSTYDQNDPRETAKCSKKAPCYNSPALATNQERTLSSTYDQNDPREAAKRSHKAPCYNSPALTTDQERTLSTTYDQNDPREAAKRSHKAPCYNSPALATDQERTLSNTYGQHDPSEAVCNTAESPGANSYQPAALPSSESGTLSAISDENHRSGSTIGRGNSYICPSPAASADRPPAAAYSQNDRREAINDTPDSPETNNYEPANCEIQ